ncbi:MAG: TRAP transporter substrate-binding protein DctP [Pseudomonadota bacterium]|nr:TRAP transporter substrate-binding protein DctP [Pseudomonadota bacterium]
MAGLPPGLLALLILFLPLQINAQTLKIATLSPDGTSWMRAMREAGDEIEKRSSGRVKLRFYPGGVMGNDKSVMRKIRVGQLQGGAVTPGALASADKDVQVYSIPFLFRNLGEVEYVRSRMDARLLKGLERKGFVSFGFAEGGFAYFMSRYPVRTVDDLRARKVWSPEGDRITLTAFDALGISPVTLPLTDVLTALQTGLVDTVASPAVGAIALQWHTRVKYLTDVPLTYSYGMLVVSNKAFKKLSAKDQSLVRDVLSRTFERIDRQNRRDDAQALRTLKRQGIEVISPPPKDLESWRRTVDTAQQRLERQGFFSKDVVSRVRKLLADYRHGKR